MNPRRLAAQTINRVLEEGAYSHIALNNALERCPDMDPRDRALTTELVYGTLTWLRELDAILNLFIKKGLRRVDPQVQTILRVAVYQIARLDKIPPRAAVHQAVEEAGRLRRGKAIKGFVNGVLRSVVRGRDKWPTPVDASKDEIRHLATRWSMTNGLARHLVKALGFEEAQTLAEAMTLRPGYALRVVSEANIEATKASRDALCAELPEARPTPISPSGLLLKSLAGDAVRSAIEAGRIVVQDEAAQLVSWLASPAPASRVLDTCAGLGGKTAHLASLCGSDGLVAVDVHAQKLEVLKRTFAKLGLGQATCLGGDLRQIELPSGSFDTVLVDAPCDGLGVIRRHPELRWRDREKSVESLVTLQAELLDRAVDLLAPGGVLVYSVCTFTEAQGPGQIQALLERHPCLTIDAPRPDIPWEKLRPVGGGWYALPHLNDTDGFFMARLKRT